MEVSGQLHTPAARGRAPDTHWIGGWVDLRIGLDMVSKRKIPSFCQDSNPDHPIVQPAVSRYTDCAPCFKNLLILSPSCCVTTS
jgi:hypothetical protein